MHERIILLAAVAAAAGIFSYLNRRTRKINTAVLPEKFRNNNSLPTIIYFWTEQCVQCRVSQKPALSRLKESGQLFNLVSINALEEAELATYFGIKTVPGTIIFSSAGKGLFFNNGYINEEALKQQISG